jgi:hypothetical protein
MSTKHLAVFCILALTCLLASCTKPPEGCDWVEHQATSVWLVEAHGGRLIPGHLVETLPDGSRNVVIRSDIRPVATAYPDGRILGTYFSGWRECKSDACFEEMTWNELVCDSDSKR